MTRKLNKHHSVKENNNDTRPVSQEEFDRVIKDLLNSPPRKKRRGGK